MRYDLIIQALKTELSESTTRLATALRDATRELDAGWNVRSAAENAYGRIQAAITERDDIQAELERVREERRELEQAERTSAAANVTTGSLGGVL